MNVLSPVGRFRVTLGGIRVEGGRPVLDVRMGAWRSEVTFDRHDASILAAGFGALACAVVGGWILGSRGSQNS
jgi:hypothetical protein